MDRSTGSLVAASDGWSGSAGGCHKTIGTAPVVIPLRQTAGTGAGPTPHSDEGADMAKRTRGVPGSDSETRDSAVKITLASRIPVTVPSTPSIA